MDSPTLDSEQLELGSLTLVGTEKEKRVQWTQMAAKDLDARIKAYEDAHQDDNEE